MNASEFQRRIYLSPVRACPSRVRLQIMYWSCRFGLQFSGKIRPRPSRFKLGFSPLFWTVTPFFLPVYISRHVNGRSVRKPNVFLHGVSIQKKNLMKALETANERNIVIIMTIRGCLMDKNKNFSLPFYPGIIKIPHSNLLLLHSVGCVRSPVVVYDT